MPHDVEVDVPFEAFSSLSDNADIMVPQEVAKLGSYLLIHSIRSSTTEQPKDISDNTNLFDQRISQVVKLMEDTVEEPLSIYELSQRLGLSSRHLERLFKVAFKTTPMRFYKQLRINRARVFIMETQMTLADIATATGFTSTNALSLAFRNESGKSPTEMRVRNKTQILDYDTGYQREQNDCVGEDIICLMIE